MRRSCAGLTLSATMLLIFAAAGRAASGAGDVVESPATPPPPEHVVPSSEVFSADEITRLKALLAEDTERKRLERDKPRVDFYGYLKLDMAWDSAAMSEGDFARWVLPEVLSKDDDQFSLTVRETRVGVKLTGPNSCGMEIDGCLEIDFYGGGSDYAEWLKLRHAFVRLTWPRLRLAVLAGQTWDTHVPLHMPTINYTVGWWVGNLGFRRPQVRVTKDIPLGGCRALKLEAAAARTITGRSTPFTPAEQDTGEDVGFPSFQGRISLSGERTFGGQDVIGLSGHFGQEEWDRDGGDHHSVFDSWSLALDLTLPVSPCLQLTGEAWMGSNLNAYFGGIGQGLNIAVPGAEHEIASRGAWLALKWKAAPRWTLATGAAFDDPKNADLAAGMRSFNTTGFVNAWYRLRKPLAIGLELSYWNTEYVALARGNGLRVQTAIKYEF